MKEYADQKLQITLASSRRSVSWGALRKLPLFSPIFSLAGFRAAPQLTERLEQATTALKLP